MCSLEKAYTQGSYIHVPIAERETPDAFARANNARREAQSHWARTRAEFYQGEKCMPAPLAEPLHEAVPVECAQCARLIRLLEQQQQQALPPTQEANVKLILIIVVVLVALWLLTRQRERVLVIKG